MANPSWQGIRVRWAAIGAAVAVTLGAGGIGAVRATSPSGATTFVPITPCRIADTRPGTDNVGSRSGPLNGGETHTISAHGTSGQCSGLPTSATGLSLNVTAVGATAPTFLTIWPEDEPRPTASSLNPGPGQPPAPNAVTTGLSPTGQFSVFNLQGSVHTIIDVNGYYTDHAHDDRYYTKSEVDARIPESDSITVYAGGFTPFDGSLVEGGATTCFRHDSSGTIQAALPLPVGTVITGITVRSYSSAVTAPAYTVSLRRQPPDSAVTQAIVLVQPLLHNSGLATEQRTLPTPETVDAGEALFATFVATPVSIGLCSVQIHFRRPA